MLKYPYYHRMTPAVGSNCRQSVALLPNITGGYRERGRRVKYIKKMKWLVAKRTVRVVVPPGHAEGHAGATRHVQRLDMHVALPLCEWGGRHAGPMWALHGQHTSDIQAPDMTYTHAICTIYWGYTRATKARKGRYAVAMRGLYQ